MMHGLWQPYNCTTIYLMANNNNQIKTSILWHPQCLMFNVQCLGISPKWQILCSSFVGSFSNGNWIEIRNVNLLHFVWLDFRHAEINIECNGSEWFRWISSFNGYKVFIWEIGSRLVLILINTITWHCYDFMDDNGEAVCPFASLINFRFSCRLSFSILIILNI